jgi:tRNA A-37 threonylcarbamoyl transferase component Bud32
MNKALAAKVLDAPDALVEGQQLVRLKSGNTCTVSLAEINGRKLVVKRYNIKSFWHWLGRCWRPSRAAKSWANAHRLSMYGIATAAPVALLERRFGLLRGKAYFLAEYIQAPNVADILQDASISQERKKSVLEAVAKLMYKLMLLQIVHGDLKASNIHIDGKQPVLIDLDSLQEYKRKARFEKNHVRDLKRLLKNWENQPEVRQWLIDALQKTYGEHHLLARALYKN